MSEPINSEPESTPETKKKLWHKRIPLLPIALGGAVVLCLGMFALVISLVIRALTPPSGVSGIPLEVVRVSPDTSPLPLPPPPVVEVGGDEMALPIPVTLEVASHSFPIRPTEAGQEIPDEPTPSSDAAIWVYGTVVRYVLGLQATAENQALVEELSPGDSIQLRLSNGAQLTFLVVRQDTILARDPSVFSQSRPGLTLVLLGDGEAEQTERLAVFADFEQREEPPAPDAGPAAGVGQPVQVGGVRVTVVEAHAEPGSADLPPGMMAYLVEFSVESTSDTPVDMGIFVMELVDGVQNRYYPSPSTAAQEGRYGPPEGELRPGAQVNVTAGYMVPESLVGPNLIWVFGPQPSTELHARFTIPYEPAHIAPSLPQVDVTQAFLGEGDEVIHVVARIRNTGTVAVTVTADDIFLSSSAGAGELRLAAPPFPWTIEAGDTREVELQFGRPDADTALVTILGYTFEISGLL